MAHRVLSVLLDEEYDLLDALYAEQRLHIDERFAVLESEAAGAISWSALLDGPFAMAHTLSRLWHPNGPCRALRLGLPDDIASVLVQARRQHPGWRRLPHDIVRRLVWRFIVPNVALHEIGP